MYQLLRYSQTKIAIFLIWFHSHQWPFSISHQQLCLPSLQAVCARTFRVQWLRRPHSRPVCGALIGQSLSILDIQHDHFATSGMTTSWNKTISGCAHTLVWIWGTSRSGRFDWICMLWGMIPAWVSPTVTGTKGHFPKICVMGRTYPTWLVGFCLWANMWLCQRSALNTVNSKDITVLSSWNVLAWYLYPGSPQWLPSVTIVVTILVLVSRHVAALTMIGLLAWAPTVLVPALAALQRSSANWIPGECILAKYCCIFRNFMLIYFAQIAYFCIFYLYPVFDSRWGDKNQHTRCHTSEMNHVVDASVCRMLLLCIFCIFETVTLTGWEVRVHQQVGVSNMQIKHYMQLRDLGVYQYVYFAYCV